MKILFLIHSILIWAISASSQTINNNNLILGQVDSVDSKVLKETRRFWVYLPASYKGGQKSMYPVLYVLDGDIHFHSISGVVQYLSEKNGNKILPETIVVAIHNTDRTRDLTPTNVTTEFDGSPAPFLKTSGGGENFTNFIERELIPYVNSHYPAASYKVLIGHSFGGLFALNTLMNHPDLFNGYVSIDPSLWWDKQVSLKNTPRPNSVSTKNKTLFIGIANTLSAGQQFTNVHKDTSSSSIHIRSILEYRDKLKKNQSELKWTSKFYEKDTHSSVPLIAEYDALRYIFDFYKPTFIDSFFNPKSTANVEAALTSHYKKVSQTLGYEYLPPEGEINELGYRFLQAHLLVKAYTCFALNIKNFPNSSNVYDSMGDYYLEKKDDKKAIEYFEKALALEEQPYSREKLKKLLEGK